MEYPTDFERYIENRLKEIDDLDERRFAKAVLWDGLGKIMHRMEEEKYQAHPTNNTLFPVCPEDLNKEKVWPGEENEIYVGTLFLKADEK